MRFGRSYVQLGLIRPVSISSGDAAPSNSDTASTTESQSLAATLTGSDTNSSTETQSSSASFSGSDTASLSSESFSISILVSQSDTASGSDNQSVDTNGFPFQSDTVLGTDSSSIAASFNRTETASGADSQTVRPTLFDTASLSGETFSISATISRTETASASESQSAGGINNPNGFDSSLFVETWDVEEVSNWSPPVSGTTLYPEEEIPLVLGPAYIYVADFGTSEPTDFTALSGSWTDLGGILGGVHLSIVHTYEQPDMKQLSEKTMSRLKKRRLSVETEIAEPALINFLYALNHGTITTGSGFASYSPPLLDRATPLTYRIIVIDGWAPGFHGNGQHKKRRIILRRCLSIEGLEMDYHKEKQTTAKVKWDVHRVDAVTAPFKIIDEV